eukprot:scaffold114536_cov60-Phaeocystis_antarctica.AAC.1
MNQHAAERRAAGGRRGALGGHWRKGDVMLAVQPHRDVLERCCDAVLRRPGTEGDWKRQDCRNVLGQALGHVLEGNHVLVEPGADELRGGWRRTHEVGLEVPEEAGHLRGVAVA